MPCLHQFKQVSLNAVFLHMCYSRTVHTADSVGIAQPRFDIDACQ